MSRSRNFEITTRTYALLHSRSELFHISLRLYFEECGSPSDLVVPVRVPETSRQRRYIYFSKGIRDAVDTFETNTGRCVHSVSVFSVRTEKFDRYPLYFRE